MTAIPGPARAVRLAGWAALAAPVAWVLFALVNWVATGRFWWWGGSLPLLLFLAAPPVALAVPLMVALGRTSLSRTDRVLVGLAAAELALIVLHRLLSGRTWVWLLPDLATPPLMFAVLPLALAAVALLRMRRASVLASAGGRWALSLALAALALGAGEAGLNPRALWAGGGPAAPGALRVVSWDTLEWNNGDDPDHFYRYLTGQRADVYLLQECVDGGAEARRPIHDQDRLRREFPGYHFAAVEGLITISRYPIVAQAPLETNPQPPPGVPFLKGWKHGALRTDLLVGGHVLSMYNVHFYDMFHLYYSPLSSEFYRSIRLLDAERKLQFDKLAADLGGNPHPKLVSGNLNVLPHMGDLDRLGHLEDAGTAGTSPYPATLTFAGLRLWRMDWTLVSPGVGVQRYDLRSPEGMSSHHLQAVTVSPPAQDTTANPITAAR
ncbi:endonuclease/exonuclease/phosphatase family protein [Sphaerisporangium corydalis]|uniref:Endonuclease/exonuclease/phosphatase family protein n=1 Tax=Sphaerisporangium corydalis TaxID=1441875 RepID=A0ABV9ECE2_9ACTN|nr:endonuclease/exonuclease/phosphatase family protein [Sphaerisporangium corydalis]